MAAVRPDVQMQRIRLRAQRRVLLVLVTSLAVVGGVPAQTPGGGPGTKPILRADVSVLRPVAASIGLGTAGFLADGLAGGLVGADCTSGDQCEIGGVIGGGIVGMAVGSALGAHPGNRRRGSFPMDMLASAGATAGVIGVSLVLVPDGFNPFLLLLHVASIVASVMVGRSTGRKASLRMQTAVVPVGQQISLALKVTT
jgi:hypothetical protein